jgi:AbrB family looped-hinge helix DNA binding protein
VLPFSDFLKSRLQLRLNWEINGVDGVPTDRRTLTWYSTITGNGRTTIPAEVRKALNIKSGDKLLFAVEGDHATIRVHPGTLPLAGALASDKGKSLTIAQIRSTLKKSYRAN